MGLGELAEAGFQETNEQLKTLKARIDALETSGPFGFRMPSPVVKYPGDMPWGCPGPCVFYTYSSSITMTQNRIYYNPFYVDRPIKITGYNAALSTASSTAGAIVRAGLYSWDVGAATSNSFVIGEVLDDAGTQPADAAAHATWATDITLQPGWYLTALGCNGLGARVEYGRQLQIGMTGLLKYATSGSGVTHRGVVYLYDNSENAQISSGFSKENIAVIDAQSVNGFMYRVLTMQYEYL